MNDLSLVGAHIGGDAESLSQIPFYSMKWGMRWFQVFASSPRGAYPPYLKRELMESIHNAPLPVNIVFHSPYWVSLLSTKKYDYNWDYVVCLMEQCEAAKIPFRYVTHIGYPDDKMLDYQECQKKLLVFLTAVKLWWDRKHPKLKGQLFVESDSGHRFMWNGYNGLRSLVEIVSKIKDRRIKICADSEHIFASGEKAPRGDDWEHIGLVHLNAVPAEVKAGSHLDRHSHTPLPGTIGPRFVQHYFFRALDHGIPVIFERRDLDIVTADLEYLRTLERA